MSPGDGKSKGTVVGGVARNEIGESAKRYRARFREAGVVIVPLQQRAKSGHRHIVARTGGVVCPNLQQLAPISAPLLVKLARIARARSLS